MPLIPEIGFLRLVHIIGDPSATPPVPALLPLSRSAWWAGVKSGRFPPPVKLGPRTTAWRVEDIRTLIEDPESWARRKSSSTPEEKGHA